MLNPPGAPRNLLNVAQAPNASLLLLKLIDAHQDGPVKDASGFVSQNSEAKRTRSY